jgi:hypothetical protein
MSQRSPFRTAVVLALAMCVGVAVSAQTPAPKTATETYLAYLAAMKTAKKVEDVMPFMAAENVAMVNKTPAAQRAEMFDMLKMMVTSNSNVKVLKETPNPKGATLSVEGTGPDGKTKHTGMVEMVKEGTAWKVGKESW